MAYSVGLDFGTNSVRALVVDTLDGNEAGSCTWVYESGVAGIILDPHDHNLARQNPADYLKGIEVTVTGAIREAEKSDPGFDATKIIGIGIDTTGSSPMPVNADGTPLCMLDAFAGNPDAMVWLWKDHTSHEEAGRITDLARKMRPEYLDKCGGVYSSEWFFSKLLHCLKVAPEVFDGAFTWVEYCDWLTAVLTGKTAPEDIVRCRCAAGHKAMFNDSWGGLPDKEFLAALDPKLADLHDRLYGETRTVENSAGNLTRQWAEKLGLKEGIP
ncbi:MAG: ribulokinase, partial [Planctomycetes bacterium]|nr:ribulokinase [Planctomycetota bacterium]